MTCKDRKLLCEDPILLLELLGSILKGEDKLDIREDTLDIREVQLTALILNIVNTSTGD